MSYDIVIDAGHGGKDPGGGSNKQFLEKNMVLQISKEQKRHFDRNGIKAYMTRTTDEYLDSTPRTNRVKSAKAKYCISNHINAGGGEGAETIHSIYSTPTIATGILDVLVKEGAKRRRVFSRKGTAGDYYYMHRMTGAADTIIIEYGFADNANDTKKIIADWKKYAEAVARYYIEKVFKKKYIADGNSTSKPVAQKPTPAPKPSTNNTTHTVKKGDTLWAIAKKYNTTVNNIKSLNNLKSDLINVGQKLTIKGSAKPSPNPAPTLKVGGKVKIKSSAAKYATGQNIPAFVKGKSYTIMQIKTDRVLLKEIMSWVKKSDIQ